MSIVLLDATSNSLTVSWPGTKLAQRYILEFRTGEDDRYELLSDRLQQTQAKKNNLIPEEEYFFRVAPVFDNGVGAWMTHDEPFLPLTEEEEEYAMASPRVKKTVGGSPNQGLIMWEAVEDAYAYEVQMRESIGGADWETIAEEVQGLQIKKKNLKSKRGYQFRVRPLNGEYDEAFSAPSPNVIFVEGVGGASRAAGPPVPQGPPPNISMPAPWFKNAGRHCLLVRWQEFPGAEAYELQMRENTSKGTWTTISSRFHGTEVKKKNLTSLSGYKFRVRPLGTSEKRWSGESPGGIASA